MLLSSTAKIVGESGLLLTICSHQATPAFEAIIRPNQSMDARQMAVAVICLAVVSLSISLWFFSLGMWLVLPFAGLEVAVVGLAVGYSLRKSRGFERIIVTDKDILIVQQYGEIRREHKLPLYWAKIRWRESASRLSAARLTIGSHGRFIEIGSELVENERREFAARLQGAMDSELGKYHVKV